MTPLYRKHKKELSDYQLSQIVHIYRHNTRQLGLVHFFDNTIANNVELFFWVFFGSCFIFYFLWESWLCFLPMILGFVFFISVGIDAVIYEISLSRIVKKCQTYVDGSLTKPSVRFIIKEYYDKTTRKQPK
jgi:hypothetical protein